MKIATRNKPHMELLCMLSPMIPARIDLLAIDLNTTKAGVERLCVQLDRLGFTTETTTFRGMSYVFTAPAAAKKIKAAATSYWEDTYGW